MYQADPLFAEFVDSHFDDFYFRYEWHGRIDLSVEEDKSRAVKFSRVRQELGAESGYIRYKIFAA